MHSTSRYRLLAICFVAPAIFASAQDKPLTPPDVLQEKLGEWVETRKTISAEKADWASEKGNLENLNAIRKRESEQLAEFVTAAGERVDELAKKRAEFADEEKDLIAWRRDLEDQVVKFEEKLRPILGRFPPPLRSKTEEALIRVESADEGVPLQNRIRDVLLLTQAWLEFHNSITTDVELREIDGEKRELNVLYLGATQAFYVDASGRYSGYGVPGDDGWTWTEDKSLASRIRLAIDVKSRSETPQFVKLPIVSQPSSSE